MSIVTMRLVMGILFLLLAGVMFGRRWLLPGLDAHYDTMRMNLGAVLALVFGGLNLARWYAMVAFRRASRTAIRYPLQPDPSAEPQIVPNPELDFTKAQKTDKPELDTAPERKPRDAGDSSLREMEGTR